MENKGYPMWFQNDDGTIKVYTDDDFSEDAFLKDLNHLDKERPYIGKVDTGMMSQKQKAQFFSYMEESFKEAKKNGR